MPGFEDFHTAIGQTGSLLIQGMTEADREAANRNMSALLRESEPEPGPEPRVLRPDEELAQKLLFGFSEILESVDNLHNIAVYVRRFPYTNSGVEKGAYLRYHVENYLQELYILKERLKSYLTAIARAYRLDPRGPRLRAIAKAIEKHFHEAFAGTLRARGAHVHQHRYSDMDLERLKGLELVRESAGLQSWYENVYRETRRRKLKWIKGTNRSVDQLLDVYFEYLRDQLFDADGNLRQPQAAAQQALQPDAQTSAVDRDS
jgi:predicted transcriptional regulator with HTH domain